MKNKVTHKPHSNNVNSHMHHAVMSKFMSIKCAQANEMTAGQLFGGAAYCLASDIKSRNKQQKENQKINSANMHKNMPKSHRVAHSSNQLTTQRICAPNQTQHVATTRLDGASSYVRWQPLQVELAAGKN